LWLHSLKVAQLLRSAACLHTNQSWSYLNHLVFILIVKCKKFVLLKLTDNWFALNHSLKVAKIIWMFLLKTVRLEWVNKILLVVSSVKIIVAEVLFIIYYGIILGKLFICRRNSRGPKTESCGIPCLTLAQLETLILLSLSYFAVLHCLLSR